MLEATGFAVRHNLEHLLTDDMTQPRVVAAGGGVQAAVWPQIVSDITGLDQLVPAEHAGACYGAALLAGLAGAGLDQRTDWSRASRIVTPAPEHRDLYDRLYGIYRDLYPATRAQMHALAELQATQT
jgi:xylulokinase